jgi:hypothetical protein
VNAPLTFAWRNVVFAHNVDDPWALYRLRPTAYAGLPTAGKVEVLSALAAFASAVEADFQLLRIARTASVVDYVEAARSTVDRRFGHADLFEHVVDGHARMLADEITASPVIVLAVSLRAPAGLGQSLRSLFDQLASVCGLRDARGISQRRLDHVLDAEQRAFGRAGDYLEVDRLSTRELQWLLARTGRRALTEPTLDVHWRPQALVLDADDEDGGRRFVPSEAQLVGLLDEPMTVHRDHVAIGESVQATLVAGSLPESTVFPGRQAELLFAPLEAVGFSVDACFAARWIPNDTALALVRRRIVDADHALSEESRGEHGPTAQTAVRPDVARELEDELTGTDRSPLLRAQLSYLVAGRDGDELDHRVRMLRRELAPITLHRPKDIQLALWISHLPGQRSPIRRYDDIMLPEQFGAMVPTATADVGAETGLLIGHTLTGARRPVLFDVTEGSRTSRPPAVLCTGTLGSGKTLTAQLLAWHAFVGGSQVVDLDPKGDHRLADVVGEGNVEHIELSADERHRGLLDPLRIGPEDLRVELAYSFLTELLPAPVLPGWQTEIRAAVTDVAAGGGRSCGLVLDRLRAAGDEGRAAARALEVHAGTGLLQLGFAHQESRDPAVARRPLVSLRIANLTLPVPGTPKADLTQEERTGRALLRLLAVHALHLAGDDWSRHKVLVIEELSQLIGDAIGQALIGRMVRLCRSQNATPILRTQMVDDVGAVSDLIGCFLAFGVETEREAVRVLQLLGLDPDDRGLRAQLRSFRRGRCLMRDYEGRIGPVQIDLADDRLLAALDTTPRERSGSRNGRPTSV